MPDVRAFQAMQIRSERFILRLGLPLSTHVSGMLLSGLNCWKQLIRAIVSNGKVIGRHLSYGFGVCPAAGWLCLTENVFFLSLICCFVLAKS